VAVGKTLEEVLAKYDWRQFTCITGIAAFLLEYGVTLGLHILDEEGSEMFDVYTLRVKMDRPAICSVDSAVNEGGQHWVFWDGKQFLDSSVPQDVYRVREIHFLTYYADFDWCEGFPDDWRKWIYRKSTTKDAAQPH
jgi:hypothetical protein